MKRILISISTAIIVATTLSGCSTVAFTGRNQVLMYSSSEIMSLSEEQYKSYMTTSTLSTNKAYKNATQQVGQNLINGLKKYVAANNIKLAVSPDSYNWTFEVVKDASVNAFCLPNGRIVVYEGMFTVADTPNKLAVVLGHEIGHAIAQHGNERATQEALTNVVAQTLGTLASKDQQQQALLQAAFAMGGQYGYLLPYSRKHEYEADRLGLIIMSVSGYDPNSAATFWESMSSGNSTSDFFSTHPSDEKRVKNLNSCVSEAQGYATKSGTKAITNANTRIK